MSHDFNPKCNQSAGAGTLSQGGPSCAEVAEQAMRAHAAHRAQQKAWEEAMKAKPQTSAEQLPRWLKPSDISG